ncbi:MAG: enoyl-CoA hydratase-related protein [Chloroflexota bacterium]|nr:enoyl-CoA hydratase-related protein [Chloroflexota bacterium]
MTVHYQLDGRRATVRLDRPDVLNALNRETLDGIADAFHRAAADQRVGVVVLTGTGERAFCTGADLDEQEQFLVRPSDYWTWMGHFIAAVDAIRDCPKPVVARLNGMTVGGGNELNLACDLAVAADDIVLRHVGPSRGSVPAGGATQWMPLVVGDRRAREVLLLNRPVSARTALEWGWVNRVVPRAELDAAVDELCADLLAKMPEIVRATKAQLHFWKDLSWALTIRHAREWLTIHAASEEVAEGLDSFRAKRPPDYERLRAALEAGARRGAPCPSCGRSDRPQDAAFCPYCGTKLSAPPNPGADADGEPGMSDPGEGGTGGAGEGDTDLGAAGERDAELGGAGEGEPGVGHPEIHDA